MIKLFSAAGFLSFCLAMCWQVFSVVSHGSIITKSVGTNTLPASEDVRFLGLAFS